MINVNAVEAFWIVVNLATFIGTALALIDARLDREAVKKLNGPIRTTIAVGNVRREWLRLVVQVILLAIAVPSIFAPGDVTWSPILFVFLAMPVVLLISTLADRRDRIRLNKITTDSAVKALVDKVEREAEAADLKPQEAD